MAERAPGMETASEAALLITFADQAQAAWPLVFFRACVLDVHLVRKTVDLGSPLKFCWTDHSAPSQMSVQGDGGTGSSEPARPASVLSLPYLASLQTQLDLHLACLGPNPHVDLRTQRMRWSCGFLGLLVFYSAKPRVFVYDAQVLHMWLVGRLPSGPGIPIYNFSS